MTHFFSGRRNLLKGAVLGTLSLASAPAARIGHVFAAEPRQRQGETLIRNGLIIGAEGRQVGDVLTRGDVIAGVGKNLSVTGPGARVIEAGGLPILPGGIDPHVHLSGGFIDNYTSGSQAALAGGITTLGEMSEPENETLSDMAARYAQRIHTESIADVMLHPIITDPSRIDQLRLLANAGHTSIKIFMPMESFSKDVSGYIKLLEKSAELGILPMFHCENYTILQTARSKLQKQGYNTLEHYAQSRPKTAEVLATQQAVAMCEITGCPIYIVHLSCERALAVCEDARARGLPVYVETRPLYLHLTAERHQALDGALYTGMPPLRDASDVAALWKGLASGAIDTVASDHAPWSRAQKLDPKQDLTDVRAGMSNLQVMLPMLYSEGVIKNRISLERFVALTSTNAAKLFGLYPRKGVIAVGSDADLVLWNPALTKPVRASEGFSRADYSAYEGWQVTGWPRLTVRRGEVVFEDGRVTGRQGSGGVLYRKQRLAL